MDATTIILISVIIVFMFYGEYLFSKFKYCKENQINDEIEYPKVSIIIPARNEESNIAVLLNSINFYFGLPYEVIVVNDNSSDKTKEVALGLGAKILDSEPLPEGWKGKPWACWQGAKFAQGDLFIFLDADTKIEPKGIKRIIDSYLEAAAKKENQDGVVLSIAPYHKVERFYESFSSIFNIIMVGSMNAFTPNSKQKPTGLFGQTLVIRKVDYFKIDGHKAVKDMILENVFMAKLLLEKGVNLELLGGKGVISFRMYPEGFKSLVDGWTKAFAKGAGQTPFGTLIKIIFWITAGFMIAILFGMSFFANEHSLLWKWFYIGYVLQTYSILIRLGNFRFSTALFFPIYLIFYVVVFSRSLYYVITKKSINWKAREVAN